MKLHKILTVAGKVYPLAKDDTRLDLNNPGRASYQLTSEQPVEGIVTLDISYNDSKLKTMFFGYVETCTQINNDQFIIFCRELAYRLTDNLPISLRHCTMIEVIKKISQVTGLKFLLPPKPYTKNQAPFFYNLANGFYALDTLGDVFNIPQYFWQQQPTGEIFCGSYADSFFGLKDPLILETKLFKNYQGNSMATITPLPGIFPGAKINDNQIITSVILTNEDMVLKWKKL